MLFSTIIPIYNEEEILESSLSELHTSLKKVFADQQWEIILVENGSTDKTAEIAEKLSNEIPELKAVHSAVPDYGKALRTGILAARGKYIIGDEIDLGNIRFYTLAIAILENSDVDMVIGSKALPGAQDNRPFIRRLATKTINTLLKVTLNFKGTDTHGLKAFKRSSLLIEIVENCQTGGDLFASELVIRAERAGLEIMEIPVKLEEKRPPAIKLFKRVPAVIKGLVELRKILGKNP